VKAGFSNVVVPITVHGTFFELNLKDPDASRDLAEYVDGNVVFK
jgi:hypothetical protein